MEQTSRSQTDPAIAFPSIETGLPAIVDELPDGVLVLDENWRITYANRSAREISRLRPEDINGPTLWEVFPDHRGTPLETTYRKVMETRLPGVLEAYFYEPFGIWVEIHVLPAGNGIVLCYRDVTSARRAEQERRSASERLEQVLAATSDGVITLDRDFRVTFMNRRAQEMLAPGGDIMGQNLFESFPSAVYENSPYVENYQRAMTERVVTSFEAFYPDPLNLWFKVVARPSPEGIVVFFRDITESRNKQEALRASEKRYRILTELSPLPQWTADAAGRVLYVNQRFLDFVGHDFVPLTGAEFIQCFAEEDRERVLRVWSHSVATGADYSIEARLLRAGDRAARWWHLRALPVLDDSGAVRQWLGIASDIHERHTIAEQLRVQYAEIDRGRRELEAIYQGSPIGMALYEPKELRLLRINPRQSQIFDVAPEEAIGKTVYELMPGFTPAHHLMQRAAAGEPVLNQSIEGILGSPPSGSNPAEVRSFNVNYSPILAQDGSVLAIAGATIEVTQQKRAEAALIQSEKLAAVGRMASSIAHEINNPLESVTNLIYIARQYTIVPEVQEFLSVADQELRRVSIIANQTLRFHKQASLPREISCLELFSTVLSLYEGRLRNSTIVVEKRKRAHRPVHCFEGDIRQVLNNLVGNAIDSMPTGGRLILRSREATDWRTGRQGIVLTVADTGTGMSGSTRSRVFEPFFTTKGINGSGLGLWISTEIVQRHQGRLLVFSREGQARHGSVFSLFLPFEGSFFNESHLLN